MRWIEWLRDRSYYDDQLVAHREIPGHTPTYAEIDLNDRLEGALEEIGVDQLYTHQVDAIRSLRDGRDVVLATPTASGKSLAYTVPAMERALDHGERTLYIGPQNALIADQEETMADLARGLGFGSRVSVRQYTGRMDRSDKQAVRDRQPTVMLTTPDMLHYGLLPHARRLWRWLFSSLSLVVVDEVHAYRGIFGSNVSLVLRRLQRICEEFGSEPQFVACSATIGNPRDHVAALTGRSASRMSVIPDDRSATGPRSWAFWRPPAQSGAGHGRRRSAHVETMNLFLDLVSDGYQTVTFCQSRQLAERYAMQSQEQLRDRGERDLAKRVHAYEAALSDDRRTTLEDGLNDGSVRGVWSTSALELGVDIGGMDAVLLDGYPGTRTETNQRAGRAGRGSDASLVVLVGGEDQLDQYILQHPDAFFDGDPEQAIVNPENKQLRPQHLRSAARETWLRRQDTRYFGEAFDEEIRALVDRGLLRHRSIDGEDRWMDAGSDSPQHAMNLRHADGDEIALIRKDTGDTIATLSRSDAIRDAHPGAIYHHQGQAFEVIDLDLDAHRAEVTTTWANHYTRIRHDKDITVEEVQAEQTVGEDVPASLATMHVKTRVTGFARKDSKTGETISEEPLTLPESELHTEGLIVTIPPAVQSRFTGDADFLGGIHAVEHGLISLFPVEVLCDRGDVGGLSTPHHPHTGSGTIFVYDGYPGGVGLSRTGFDHLGRMLDRTRSLIAGCDCVEGCPACVQSPQCGNGNDPLDPDIAVAVLEALLPEGVEGNSDERAR